MMQKEKGWKSLREKLNLKTITSQSQMVAEKIGLILIGGSLKGIYGHTGVVVALHELGIRPDVILGASAGSIVASFMATEMSPATMKHKMTTLSAEQFLDKIKKFDLFKEFVFNKGRHLYGFVKGDKIEEYVREALGEKDDFSKTSIPLYISATNLKTLKLTLFNTGAISEKSRASTAIPMLFCPKQIGGQYYIDGAIQKDKLPGALLEVRPDLDYLIVSNFSYEQETDDNSYLEDSKLPLVEIVRRVMSIHEKFRWPRKLGKTHIIYIEPGLTIPVDIFRPSPDVARSVYHDSNKYAKYHLQRYFKRAHRHKKPQQGDQNGGTSPTPPSL
jgi:predicted acylesterase/phospholipase RssA